MFQFLFLLLDVTWFVISLSFTTSILAKIFIFGTSVSVDEFCFGPHPYTTDAFVRFTPSSLCFVRPFSSFISTDDGLKNVFSKINLKGIDMLFFSFDIQNQTLFYIQACL